MDKAMLIAMLAQQAPKVLAMLNNSVDNTSVENVENLIANKGYDPGMMEETTGNILAKLNSLPEDSYQRTSLEPIDFLKGHYSTDIFENDTNGAFPSDGINPQPLANLFETLNPDERQMIGGAPAELAAATFLSSPEQLPELPENNVIPGTQIPVQEDVPSWPDSDMDDIHSSEMWQQGDYHPNPELKKWYKQHKR